MDVNLHVDENTPNGNRIIRGSRLSALNVAKLIVKKRDLFTDTAAILNKLDLRVLWEAQGE